MKIGVYAGNWQPNTGGGFSFFETILNGLLNFNSNHTFYIFHESNSDFQDSAKSKFIAINSLNPIEERISRRITPKEKIKEHIKKLPLLKNIYFEIEQVSKKNIELSEKFAQLIKRQNQYFNYYNNLNKAAISHKIEFMWFLTPSFLPVQIPYCFTLWDLSHINHSCFPEVNYSGWTWEEREKLYSIALRKATYIIVGTNEGKRETIEYYNLPSEKIKVIPFTPTLFLPNENTKGDEINKPYIFYPAQFWPHKNHVVILYAIKLLNEKYNLKIQCIFTGSDKGNEVFIKKMVVKLGLKDLICFKGFVDKNELHYFYKNALALVFPSFFGPDNIPPIEAFSLGCPVIASDIPGHREQLKDAALFFNPTNEEQLADTIKLLVDDESLRNTLINRGLEIIKSLSIENYFQEMNKLLLEFSKMRRCWDSENIYTHL